MKMIWIITWFLFTAIRVYGLSLNALRWATCIRVIAGNTIDAAFNWFLRRKLKQALQPAKLVKLIKLIQGNMF